MESVPPSPRASPSTISEFLASLPDSATWALQELSFTGSLPKLLSSLPLDQAIAVSDGSYADHRGTASWILTNQHDSVSGLCSIPGVARFHNSYRSELGGLYGILLFLWSVEQVYPAIDIHLSIYCDGLEAIRK